jgi:hypothetical protein
LFWQETLDHNWQLRTVNEVTIRRDRKWQASPCPCPCPALGRFPALSCSGSPSFNSYIRPITRPGPGTEVTPSVIALSPLIFAALFFRSFPPARAESRRLCATKMAKRRMKAAGMGKMRKKQQYALIGKVSPATINFFFISVEGADRQRQANRPV